MSVDQKERAVAAIVGCVVSDAAAQPLHWIYNLGKLDGIVGSRRDSVEFWEPSHNPFYCIETGRGTSYADQTQTLLESLVACEGFNKADFAQRLKATFGPGSRYDNKLNSKYVMKSGKQKGYPIDGPWNPKVIKDFLAKYAQGMQFTGSRDVADMGAVVPVVAMVAMYAGRAEMLEKVEEALTVLYELEEAVAVGMAAARILEQFVLHPGMDGVAAIEAVMQQLSDPKRANPNDLDRAVIGQLKNVLEKKTSEHRYAAKKFFLNS
ncbi:crystallin J1A-like [Asterias amurensis]|uniref:crystallin J1A-like n=1 Tax=Asterias amurensis TaxID=7602 RepID=UPI003AB73D4D